MAKGKKHSPEQIVSLLRQIEVAPGFIRKAGLLLSSQMLNLAVNIFGK